MQEVEGYLSGERDYTKLRGDTGPLVYPAGFLYIFSVLRSLTEAGTNIFAAQCIFIMAYLLTLCVTLYLYMLEGTLSVASCTLLVISKRIHSIFMLRMFNDTVAFLFGLLALVFFCKHRYRFGCVLYSIGVSVKMNMFLWAPGVLVVLLTANNTYMETVICLAICALVQLVLGFPFLSTYPVEYLKKSFELDRVFTYKWTVNFKFLSEEIFLDKRLSIVLLLLTIIGYLLFAFKWSRWIREQSREYIERQKQEAMQEHGSDRALATITKLTPSFIISTVFVSNFIGIVFSRTIHYQFYCWYFHTLPFLLWFQSPLHIAVRVIVMFGIEFAYNVYPATALSSTVLQVCHFSLLLAIFATPLGAEAGTGRGTPNQCVYSNLVFVEKKED